MGTITQRYSQPLETVYAKLTDPEHLRARSAAAGHKNIELTVTEKGTGVEIRLERDIESEIPAIARKVVNPVNHVIDVIRWEADGDGKRGTYEAKVNARITVRGKFTLRAAGGGCVYTDTCDPKVDVPLIGKKIAGLVAKETEKSVAADQRFTQKALDAD